MCYDLNLGPVTKARSWKGVGQKCSPGITFTFPRVWESLKEWMHTLPNGLPFWELESQWTSKSSSSDLKGQNSLDWRFPYTIENLLKRRCLKWAHMIHLNTYNISYGPKKGKESKCQFDFWPLKVRNRPKLCVCRRHVRYHWKFFYKRYNFASNFISIKSLHKKFWVSKMVGVPISRIIGLST
jgi:hypothetical protein